jgi:hypothetical protein
MAFILPERKLYRRYSLSADQRGDAGSGRGYAVYFDSHSGSSFVTLQWVNGDLRRGEAILDGRESPEHLLFIVVAFLGFQAACEPLGGGG